MKHFSNKKLIAGLFIVIALIFGLTAVVPTALAATHQHKIGQLQDYETVNYGKQKYRCKLCGKTFNTWLVVAGHLRGNHGKWLYHKYYEKI